MRVRRDDYWKLLRFLYSPQPPELNTALSVDCCHLFLRRYVVKQVPFWEPESLKLPKPQEATLWA